MFKLHLDTFNRSLAQRQQAIKKIRKKISAFQNHSTCRT